MGKTPTTLDLQSGIEWILLLQKDCKTESILKYSVKEMDSFLECKIYFGFPVLSILGAYPT